VEPVDGDAEPESMIAESQPQLQHVCAFFLVNNVVNLNVGRK
jgi:hypothetical protein